MTAGQPSMAAVQGASSWPGCPGLSEKVTPARNGVRVVVSGNCFGHPITMRFKQTWFGHDTAYLYKGWGRIHGHRIAFSGEMTGGTSPMQLTVAGVPITGHRPSRYPEIHYEFIPPGGTAMTAWFRIGQHAYACRGPVGPLGSQPMQIFHGTYFDIPVTPQVAQSIVGGLCAALIEASYPHIGPS